MEYSATFKETVEGFTVTVQAYNDEMMISIRNNSTGEKIDVAAIRLGDISNFYDKVQKVVSAIRSAASSSATESV